MKSAIVLKDGQYLVFNELLDFIDHRLISAGCHYDKIDQNGDTINILMPTGDTKITLMLFDIASDLYIMGTNSGFHTTVNIVNDRLVIRFCK